MVTLDCTLHLFNVLDPEQRTLCMDMMEKDFTGPGKENRERFLIIAGGDGSLCTTVNMLRTRPVIEEALREKRLSFICLPFGTGCDNA